jgi:hypothetical protein
MKPTRIPFLVAIAVIGVAVGWALVEIVSGQTGRAIPVPLLAGTAIWLLAIALSAWTWFLRPRLRRDPGSTPVPPLAAARTAAFAMAASRTGAVVAGIYTGIAVATVAALATPAGASAFGSALLAATGSLVLAGAALWLEGLCRIPEDDESDNGAGRVGS